MWRAGDFSWQGALVGRPPGQTLAPMKTRSRAALPRRISALLFTLTAALVTTASSAADGKLTLTHLRGGVYVVEDSVFNKENSVVYVGPESVTVIGATMTPETAAQLAAEISKVTSKPITEVVNTNYHPDRAGGNAYFRDIGARVVARRETYLLMLEHWSEMVESTRQAFPSYPELPLVLPDRTFTRDFELQDGRVRALYLGPSHSPDGIFVYFPREKVLYGGCILKEQLGSMATADVAEYPRTLRKLKALNLGFTTIVAGHWSPIHGPELLDRYLELLERK